MDWTNQHKSLLHDGLSKRQRKQSAPQPNMFKPEGSDTRMLLSLAQEWSRNIAYVNEDNVEEGNWEAFLAGNIEEFCQFLEDSGIYDHDPVKKNRLSQPHFVLFLGFLKLYNISRNSFNQLTQRHLDYYYQSFLKLKQKKPVVDQLHVRLILDENEEELGLPAGTCLTASSEEDGRTLEYFTEHEIVVNHAEVSQSFSLCRSNENFIQLNQAPPECLALAPNPKSWDPFYSPDFADYTHARLGLAIASPLLFFDEGSIRNISLKVTCVLLESQKSFFEQDENRICKIKLTTQEGILEVQPFYEMDERLLSEANHFTLTLDADDDEESSQQTPRPRNPISRLTQADKMVKIDFTLSINLISTFPAVVPLEEALPELPSHEWPLLCIEWLQTPPGHFEEISLGVKAQGLKNLIGQNVEGKVDTEAAFLPFGPEPRVGNKLKLTHPELINKPLDTISIKFDWSNDELTRKDALETYFAPMVQVAGRMDGEDQINLDVNEIGKANLVFHEPRGLEDVFHKKEEETTAINTPEEETDSEEFYLSEEVEEAQVNTPLARNKNELLNLETNWNELNIDAVAHILMELTGEGVLFEHYDRLLEELDLQKQKLEDNLSDAPQEDFLPPKSTVTEVKKDKYVKEFTVSYEKVEAETVEPPEEIRENQEEAGISGDSVEASNKQTLPDSLPEPFIPELKQAYVGYTSNIQLIYSFEKSPEERYADSWVDFFTLHPFGYEDFDLKPLNDNEIWNPPLAPTYDEPGTLYIGLDKVSPPQDVSILFEMLEGTAIPEAPKVRLKWEYLKSDDTWAAPSGGAPPVHLRLHDDTQQLTHAGTINFSIPEDANLDSQLLPKGLVWLRVSILPENLIPYPNELITGAICHLRSIHTQTALASLRATDYADAHYQKPLAPDSIEDFAEPLPAIVDIQQFYPSFNGLPTEPEENFYLRISERLRHKNRALSPWDYERIVLEHFPQIYKAKCLPTVERAGEVVVVVIPDRNYAKPHDPLYPKASRGELADIQELLTRFAPPFSQIKVKNPNYETLQVEFQVKFMPGTPQGHALRQLREDMVRYLSPWAFDPVAEVELDKTIYRGALTQYIQELPYVEFLAKLDLFRLNEKGKPDGPYGTLVANRPDTVWVSDREHPIYVLQGDMPQEGIGVMSVDFDFKIFPRKKGDKTPKTEEE